MSRKTSTPQSISALLRKLTRPAADPMARHCSYCHARPGEPCVNMVWGGVLYRPHFIREDEG
jgi:hypothetical protein